METADIQLLEPRPVADVSPAPAEKTTAVSVLDMKEIALSRFGSWRADAAALVKKFAGVAFAVATPKGYEEAIKARAEVRAPRYLAQRVSKASKSELAEISRAIGAEEAAVIAALKDTEEAIDSQIAAEDKRRAAEKERLATIERQRKEAHELQIAKIRGYLAQAVGRSSDVILSGIKTLEARAFPASEWEEYAETAMDARDQVCVTLREMAATAQRAEHEAAELERVKAEQARIAEEQRIERERLAAEAESNRKVMEAQRAEMARHKAEFEAWQRKAAEEKAAAEAAAQKLIDDAAATEAARLEAARVAFAAENPTYVEALQQLPETARPTEQRAPALYHWLDTPITSVAIDSAADSEPVCIPIVGVIQDEAEPIAEVPPAPPINLSTIESRLGFALRRDFIEVELGITSSHREKAAVLWPATAWSAICEGLIEHVRTLPGASA